MVRFSFRRKQHPAPRSSEESQNASLSSSSKLNDTFDGSSYSERDNGRGLAGFGKFMGNQHRSKHPKKYLNDRNSIVEQDLASQMMEDNSDAESQNLNDTITSEEEGLGLTTDTDHKMVFTIVAKRNDSFPWRKRRGRSFASAEPQSQNDSAAFQPTEERESQQSTLFQKLSLFNRREQSNGFAKKGSMSREHEAPAPLASSDMFARSTSSLIFPSDDDIEEEGTFRSKRTLSSMMQMSDVAMSEVLFPEEIEDYRFTEDEEEKDPQQPCTVVREFTCYSPEKDQLRKETSLISNYSECEESDADLSLTPDVLLHMPIAQVYPSPNDIVTQNYHFGQESRVTTAESSYDADASGAACSQKETQTVDTKSTKSTSKDSSLGSDDEAEHSVPRGCSSFSLQDGLRSAISLIKSGEYQCGRFDTSKD